MLAFQLASNMIQTRDVDEAEPIPDGQDFPENQTYPSDLTDDEWGRIAALMPGPSRCGSKRRTDFREIINTLRYLMRSGCGWEMLPVHFGPWQTVCWWFRRLMRRFLFQTIHDLCVMLDREPTGRHASSSGGVIDSHPSTSSG